MSQQLLMWNVSPFLIQQLEAEGVAVFEIFWDADEDFDIEDYCQDSDVDLNIEAILEEAMVSEEREGIETQGRFAEFIHFLLTGENSRTLTGTSSLDFVVLEKEINNKKWFLTNALVGKKVRDAEDYVASYWNPTETQEIFAALKKIEATDDFKARYQAFSSSNKTVSSRLGVVMDSDLENAKEFVSSELIPLYSDASERGNGILIGWSI